MVLVHSQKTGVDMGLQDRDWYWDAVKEKERAQQSKPGFFSWRKYFKRPSKSEPYLGFFETDTVAPKLAKRNTSPLDVHPVLMFFMSAIIFGATYAVLRLVLFLLKH